MIRCFHHPASIRAGFLLSHFPHETLPIKWLLSSLEGRDSRGKTLAYKLLVINMYNKLQIVLLITQELGHIWFNCNDVSYSNRWFMTCVMHAAYVCSQFRPSHLNWTAFFFLPRPPQGIGQELAHYITLFNSFF